MNGNRGSDSAADLGEWLEQQREFLSRLAQEQDPARLGAELEKWWQQAGTKAGPQAQELAPKLLELGQSYLQGLQQFARMAAGQQGSASQPGTRHEGAPESFDFGLDLLAAWRSARLGTDFTGLGGAAAAPWLEAMARAPLFGASREYTNDLRKLAAVHAECQRLEEALTVLLQQVQGEALADLQARVAQRAHSGEPIADFRQLYDLWIECGERAYAKAAHSREFGKLQAEFTNGLMRARTLARRLAEHVMRKLDLPTRAELNGLHLQVRDLKRKLSQYESTVGAAATNAQRSDSAPSAKPKRKPVKTTRS